MHPVCPEKERRETERCLKQSTGRRADGQLSTVNSRFDDSDACAGRKGTPRTSEKSPNPSTSIIGAARRAGQEQSIWDLGFRIWDFALGGRVRATQAGCRKDAKETKEIEMDATADRHGLESLRLCASA